MNTVLFEPVSLNTSTVFFTNSGVDHNIIINNNNNIVRVELETRVASNSGTAIEHVYTYMVQSVYRKYITIIIVQCLG